MNKKEDFNRTINHFYRKHHDMVYRLVTRENHKDLIDAFLFLDSLRCTLNKEEEENESQIDHLIVVANDTMAKIDEYAKDYMRGKLGIEEMIRTLADEGKIQSVGIKEMLETRKRESLRKERRRYALYGAAFFLGTCFVHGFLFLKRKPTETLPSSVNQVFE